MPSNRTTIPAICQQCGVDFQAPLDKVKKGAGKFCSHACYWAARSTHYRIPLADRFWPKVQKTDGCWLWMGSLGTHGYGKIGIGGRGEDEIAAHRASWELHYGPIPAGLWVLHHCDNPQCVRPDHLFLGTAADNAADKVAKGRQSRASVPPERRAKGETHGSRSHPEAVPRGERHTFAKLSDDDVREIRLRAANGEQQKDLAHEYGISRPTASNIVLRRTWKHIE